VKRLLHKIDTTESADLQCANSAVVDDFALRALTTTLKIASKLIWKKTLFDDRIGSVMLAIIMFVPTIIIRS